MQESVSRTKSVKTNAGPSGQVVFTDLIILDFKSVARQNELISTPPFSSLQTKLFLTRGGWKTMVDLISKNDRPHFLAKGSRMKKIDTIFALLTSLSHELAKLPEIWLLGSYSKTAKVPRLSSSDWGKPFGVSKVPNAWKSLRCEVVIIFCDIAFCSS